MGYRRGTPSCDHVTLARGPKLLPSLPRPDVCDEAAGLQLSALFPSPVTGSDTHKNQRVKSRGTALIYWNVYTGLVCN